MNKGHDVEAANVPQYGFIQKVQDDVRQDILSTADGQTLIDAAQNSINQLRAAT